MESPNFSLLTLSVNKDMQIENMSRSEYKSFIKLIQTSAELAGSKYIICSKGSPYFVYFGKYVVDLSSDTEDGSGLFITEILKILPDLTLRKYDGKFKIETEKHETMYCKTLVETCAWAIINEFSPH